jgi:hypothetical protein
MSFVSEPSNHWASARASLQPATFDPKMSWAVPPSIAASPFRRGDDLLNKLADLLVHLERRPLGEHLAAILNASTGH